MPIRTRRLLAGGCLVLALSFGVAACGDDEEEGGDETTSASSGGGEASGGEVTIYSSLPLQGSSRPTGIAIQNGIELALTQAGNEAGGVSINFEPLDDSTAQAGAWTPEAESANTKRAAQDESAVAYLGTFNSGAAAISIRSERERDGDALARQHRRRADSESPEPIPRSASRTSTTRPAPATTPASFPRTRSRAPRSRR